MGGKRGGRLVKSPFFQDNSIIGSLKGAKWFLRSLHSIQIRSNAEDRIC